MKIFMIQRFLKNEFDAPVVYLKDINDFNDHVYYMCHSDGFSKKKGYINSKFFLETEKIEIIVKSKSREWIYNGIRVLSLLNKEIYLDTEKKRFSKFEINFKEEEVEVKIRYGKKDKDGFEIESTNVIKYHRVFSGDI